MQGGGKTLTSAVKKGAATSMPKKGGPKNLKGGGKTFPLLESSQNNQEKRHNCQTLPQGKRKDEEYIKSGDSSCIS